jgi:hypothetical protein
MKLNETKINDLITMPLVVVAATARETTRKKPYLMLELFDGQDKILGNFWDWGGSNIPPVNTILDVNAQVTEWQGNKQLNIKSLSTNTTASLADFTPSSGFNVAEVYEEAMRMAGYIVNPVLRKLTEDLLVDLKSLWLTAPSVVTATTYAQYPDKSQTKIPNYQLDADPGFNKNAPAENTAVNQYLWEEWTESNNTYTYGQIHSEHPLLRSGTDKSLILHSDWHGSVPASPKYQLLRYPSVDTD